LTCFAGVSVWVATGVELAFDHRTVANLPTIPSKTMDIPMLIAKRPILLSSRQELRAGRDLGLELLSSWIASSSEG
jgi:hypothetical protein